jgi:hypothetical protein
MNIVRGNKNLANAKDYLYEVYAVDSVEEIMICAQEKWERERVVRKTKKNEHK